MKIPFVGRNSPIKQFGKDVAIGTGANLAVGFVFWVADRVIRKTVCSALDEADRAKARPKSGK